MFDGEVDYVFQSCVVEKMVSWMKGVVGVVNCIWVWVDYMVFDVGIWIVEVLVCCVQCELVGILIDVDDGIVMLMGMVVLLVERCVVCGVVVLVWGVCEVVDWLFVV